jgi:hypothetical protein
MLAAFHHWEDMRKKAAKSKQDWTKCATVG